MQQCGSNLCNKQSVLFSFFLSVVLRLKPRIYAVSFGFSNGSSQPVHPFLFLDFLGFFSLFPSENDSRKGTENSLAGCRRIMELSQPEGNDREKKFKKKRTLDGLKIPYKVLYMF